MEVVRGRGSSVIQNANGFNSGGKETDIAQIILTKPKSNQKRIKYLATTIFIVCVGFITTEVNAQEKIYWSDSETSVLGRMDLNTQQMDTLVQGPGDIESSAIAVDTVNNRIFWANDNTLRMATLGENLAQTLYEFPEFGQDFDIEYNYETNSVFVAEFNDEVIYRYSLDTGSGSVLLDDTDGVGFPYTLVTSSDSLYWASGRDIMFSGLDGSNPSLFTEIDFNARPNRLAIDEENGWLYAASARYFGNPPAIVRVDLTDPDNQELLIEFTSNDDLGYGIAIDNKNDRMLWINTLGQIFEADLDGQNPDTVSDAIVSGDYSNLELDEQNGTLYWSRSTPVMKEIDEEARTVFTPVVPTYFKIDEEEELLFYVDQKRIFSQDLNTGENTLIIDNSTDALGADRIELDTLNNRILWFDIGSVYSTDYEGTETDTLIDGDDFVSGRGFDGVIGGFAADVPNQTLYFTDNFSTSLGNLKKINFDGSGLDTLVSFDLDYATGLSFDGANGELYYRASLSTDSAKIKRVDTDGSNRSVFLTEEEDGIGSPFNFSVDKSGDWIYWVDIGDNVIKRSNREGTEITTLGISNLIEPVYVQVTGGTAIVNSNEYDFSTPVAVSLDQNYPNPFNPSTVISYQISTNSMVKLEVFDMLGRKVSTLVDGRKAAGSHQVTFNASRLSSGMYIYRLRAGNQVFSKKLMLIK